MRVAPRRLAKLAGLVLLLSTLALGGILLAAFPRARARWLGFAGRRGLRLFGLKLELEGSPNFLPEGLVVANHLSYLDVVAIAAVRPSLFITSREVRETPILGFLAHSVGCVFVERRTRAHLRDEIAGIARHLAQGISVTLFAEGTSSNGERVLPFKAALFDSARAVGVPIIPLCLEYRTVDGKPFGPANRDRVCYYGAMQFFPHLWELLGCREIELRMKFLPPVLPVPAADRYALAHRLQEEIRGAYRPARGAWAPADLGPAARIAHFI